MQSHNHQQEKVSPNFFVVFVIIHYSRECFSYAANEVQRCFRGHRGRKECRRRRREKAETRRMFYLHYLVGQLQRCFRGYYSRKYKQDHARRKQYCRMIEEKGRVVLEGMEKYFLDQAEVLCFLILPPIR